MTPVVPFPASPLASWGVLDQRRPESSADARAPLSRLKDGRQPVHQGREADDQQQHRQLNPDERPGPAVDRLGADLLGGDAPQEEQGKPKGR